MEPAHDPRVAHDPRFDPPPRGPRRPWGVTIIALFYIVLGSHALMFGAYLLTVTPEQGAGSLPFRDFLARDPGIVRAYGAALLAIAVPFFAQGVGLLRQRRWARWSVLLLAPLHIVGPPFLLGGLVYALIVNLYLYGSGAARAWFDQAGGGREPEAAPQP